MDDNLVVNSTVLSRLENIAGRGIENAARGFSGMLGQSLSVGKFSIQKVPLTEIPIILGGPENEATGIYLRAEGDMTGQIMMIIPYQRSLELVDLLMDTPSGTTTQLGSIERSALAEVGNLTASFFLNTLSEITGFSIRPTPPAVMVDMVGAILDIIVATCGGIGDTVLLMQTKFISGDRAIETIFWVIPDTQTLNVLLAESSR